MSGAPAASATQLSENIGDVLASIRRMIAQDPEASATTSGEISAGMRSAPADVLRLGTAAAVAPALEKTDAVPRPGISSDSASIAGQGAASLHAGGPRAEALRWANASAAHAVRAGIASGAGPQQPDHSPRRVDDACSTDERGSGSPLKKQDSATAGADDQAAFEAETDGRPYGPPSPVAATLDPDKPTASSPETAGNDSQADATPSVNNPPEAPMSMLSLASAPQDSTSAHQPTTPQDDAGASIFTSMIREVIRQELHGEGISRDLRAMILREVASALTREVVQVRPR